MTKPARTTSNPIGRKLLQVLDEQGTPDDLQALAAAFSVTVQSTYDWINHGRISKERYARLVEWSGHDLHWWFDLPPVATLRLVGSGPSMRWPFMRVSLQTLLALSEADRSTLEGLLIGAMAMMPSGAGEKATQRR